MGAARVISIGDTSDVPSAIDAFWRTLRDSGLIATIRRPRGDDIAAACGQLAGRVRDRQRVRLGDRVVGANSP